MSKLHIVKRSLFFLIIGLCISSFVTVSVAGLVYGSTFRWSVGRANYSNVAHVETTKSVVFGGGAIACQITQPANYLGVQSYIIDSSDVINSKGAWYYNDELVYGWGYDATLARPVIGESYLGVAETKHYVHTDYTSYWTYRSPLEVFPTSP